MTLTCIFGTRGRSQDVVETITATLPAIACDDTRLLVCADNDDEPTCDALTSAKFDERVIVSVRNREDSRGEKCDRALIEAPADVYLVGHDCAPILTHGFDQIILDMAADFPDGIGVVNTPHHNMSFPAYQAITAKLVDKLGHIYSHDYPFWFIDHELDDIARMIGRNPYVDINVEVGPRRPGKTLRLRELAFWTTYFDCMTFERRAKAHAIIDGGDFILPTSLKRILKATYPAIEARSLWVNNGVRNSAAAIEADRGDGADPDPGYKRLKALAEIKLFAVLNSLQDAA